MCPSIFVSLKFICISSFPAAWSIDYDGLSLTGCVPTSTTSSNLVCGHLEIFSVITNDMVKGNVASNHCGQFMMIFNSTRWRTSLKHQKELMCIAGT